MNNIDVVKSELEQLRKNLRKMSGWKKELKLIDEKINAYKDINFNELGFKTGGKTFTIDDLLEKDESRKNTLESNIFYTNFKMNEFNIEFTRQLEDDEANIIRERYMENIELKKVSFDFIANKIGYGKTYVFEKYKSAILKLSSKNHVTIEIA